MKWGTDTAKVIVLVVGGIASLASTRPDAALDGERLVSLTVEDALVGPGLQDGSEWDGPRDVPAEAWQALDAALASVNPFLAVTQFFGQDVIDALSKPDAIGTADLAIDGSFDPTNSLVLADAGSNQEDTFTPIWPGAPGWEHVPLVDGLQVRVTLFDEDLSENDPIGVAILSSDDVEAALDAGEIVHVQVDDQTNRQLLFVGISAREETE